MRLENREDELFVKHISDLALRVGERFCPQFTSFLDGRSFSIANSFLSMQGDIFAVSYGVFNGAERQMIGIFPRDIYACAEKDELYEMFDVVALKICGSGFSKFSHRDVLGSVLALGIKRETLGDIYVEPNGKNAFVCAERVAGEYIMSALEFVARDKVKVKISEKNDLPKIEKKFSVISGTVASERLDCIISLACNISRDKAKQMILSGLVNINHFEVVKCDYSLNEGDIISVRGIGRFILQEFGGITRKGRNRTVIHKMI